MTTDKPLDPKALEAAMRAAFAREASVIARIERSAGVRSRIFIHEAAGEESPLLKVPAVGSAPGVADDARYRVAGELGRGGVGIVYKAHDRDLGRDVALKVLRPEHAGNPEVIERVVEEAQIGGQLQHPGMVPIYGMGLQPDGRPSFVMKLIKGQTLGAVLRERTDPAQGLPRFLRVFEQVCQTVAYAHSRGVIHRDLKPSNVMIGGFGEVLVVDWGFGKVLGRKDPMAERLIERTMIATARSRGEGSESITGSVMGTPAYMPPEQALGQVESLDERSDVFSLGAILCEILTGKPPYVGTAEDLLILAAQARLDPAYERLEACKADPAIVAICRRALSPLPGERQEHGGALLREMDDFLAAAERRAQEAEVKALHETARLDLERREATYARGAKRKTRAIAAAAVLAVLVAGGAWIRTGQRARGLAAEVRPGAERALGEATRLLAAERWVEARGEAQRARDLAAQSELLGTLRDEAGALAVRAEESAARAKRRDALVGALEEARMQRSEHFDSVATDRAYLDAFAAAGLDFDASTAEDLAARIRAEYSDAIAGIAPALDDWAWLRRSKPELKERDRAKLHAVADSIDADPSRVELRDAGEAKDVARLRALAEGARIDSLSVRTLDTLGMALNDAGDPATATVLYRKLRDAHPDDAWVLLHLALCTDDHAEAVAASWAALALRPRAPERRRIYAAYVGEAGDDDTAVFLLRDLIREEPDFAMAAYSLGIGLRKRDPDGAIAAYREAIRIKPDLAIAHGGLGAALLDKGDAAGAVAAQREYVRLRPDSADAHHNLGWALRVKGDIDGGIAELREAIRLDPDHAGARVSLGAVLCDDMKEYDAAIAMFREAIRLKPSATAHANLSVALRKKGDPDAAIEASREAIRIDPGYAGGHGALAAALVEKGDPDGAVVAYREWVRLDPGVARAHDSLATALLWKGDAAGAVAESREAVRLAPDDAQFRADLGKMLYSTGDVAAAISELRSAIRLRPDYAEAHCLLGFALLRTGELEAAMAEFGEALRLKPDMADAHAGLGGLLVQLREFDRAIPELREVIRIQPTYVAAHINLGTALNWTGDLDGSADACREAIRLDPTQADAHLTLGIVLLRKGDHRGAIESCREAIRLKPALAEAHLRLGYALRLVGQPREGITEVREAVRLDPARADLHYALGLILSLEGDPRGAVAPLREAVRLNPDLPRAHGVLGEALRAVGDPVGAAAALREAIRIEPNHVTTRQALASVLSSDLHDFEAAIAEWREVIRLQPGNALDCYGLGEALSGAGKFQEALEALRLGSDLAGGEKQPDGLALLIGKLERMAALEPRLPDVLAGRDRPKGARERADFASTLDCKKEYAASARLFAEAFKMDPSLADDIAQGYRYEAAGAAVCAAAQGGADAAKLRASALVWLRAELKARGTSAANVPSDLPHWKICPRFAPVRDRIEELPEAEREGWRKLWADVDALIARAEGKR